MDRYIIEHVCGTDPLERLVICVNARIASGYVPLGAPWFVEEWNPAGVCADRDWYQALWLPEAK